ncbi:MAG: DMT family transporter [Clostridia bacterium]|nr:DMT family transporter [Clostridia bacterium]
MNSAIGDSNAKDRYKAIIFLIITSVLWSIGGMLIKLVEWNPIAIAGMRSAIAAVVFIIYIRKPKINWSFAQIGASICYAGTVILFVSANKMTTAANAILLQYTAPIFVAIFGFWFLKEKTKVMDWITIFFVFTGMALFFVDKLTLDGIWGNIIAILSGVTFAGLAIFMRMQKSESPIESILLGNILTAVCGLPFMFQSMPSTKSWLGLLLLGIVQLGISYILYAFAIKHVTALEAVLIPVIEPILNPVWVLVFMGETPGQWALIGGAVVLVSVTARCVSPLMEQKKNTVKAES